MLLVNKPFQPFATEPLDPVVTRRLIVEKSEGPGRMLPVAGLVLGVFAEDGPALGSWIVSVLEPTTT